MGRLEKEIAFFKSIQSKLAQDHHGSFVVIHGESVKGIHESELKAFTAARKELGSKAFLIRECVLPEEERQYTFHSRVA